MQWTELWQGIISNGIYALLILGGGFVLAWLKIKWPSYAVPAMYAFVGTACIAVILFTFTGRGLFAKHPLEITPENLEENVRKWVDGAGQGIAKMPPAMTHDLDFGIVVTLNSGNQIQVFHGKDKSGFLQMQTPLVLSPEHLAMLSRLSKEQADEAIEEITLEMNRSRIGFVMQTATAPPLIAPVTTTTPSIFQQTILVTKPIAITDLNEGRFVGQINEIDSEIGVVRGITDLTLKRYNKIPSGPIHGSR